MAFVCFVWLFCFADHRFDLATSRVMLMDLWADSDSDEERGLLKHLSTIQRMARELGQDAWRVYDQRFRVLRPPL